MEVCASHRPPSGLRACTPAPGQRGGRSSRDLVRGSCLSPPPPHFCPGGVGTLECTGFEVLVALVAHGIPRPSTRRPAPAVASLINYHLPWWGLAAPIPLWRRHCLLSGPATSPTARPAAISPPYSSQLAGDDLAERQPSLTVAEPSISAAGCAPAAAIVAAALVTAATMAVRPHGAAATNLASTPPSTLPPPPSMHRRHRRRHQPQSPFPTPPATTATTNTTRIHHRHPATRRCRHRRCRHNCLQCI